VNNRFVSSAKAKSGRKWSRGVASSEFAIVALPLFTLLFGVIAGSLATYSYNFVCTAARDAVRYAVVHGATSSSPATQQDITNLVLSEASGLDPNNISVSTNWQPDNKPGSSVSVQVTYNFHPLYPVAGTVLPLSSTSQMVISY